MSLQQLDREQIKEIFREVLREELSNFDLVPKPEEVKSNGEDIDALAEKIFDRYDDVFKALA